MKKIKTGRTALSPSHLPRGPTNTLCSRKAHSVPGPFIYMHCALCLHHRFSLFLHPLILSVMIEYLLGTKHFYVLGTQQCSDTKLPAFA